MVKLLERKKKPIKGGGTSFTEMLNRSAASNKNESIAKKEASTSQNKKEHGEGGWY